VKNGFDHDIDELMILNKCFDWWSGWYEQAYVDVYEMVLGGIELEKKKNLR